MIKKFKTIVLVLTVALFALMLTACGNEQQMGAWIDSHIEKSGDRLENHIQESQESSEQTEQQSSNWIEKHIRSSGESLQNHIKHAIQLFEETDTKK